jgi:hypothetical protein
MQYYPTGGITYALISDALLVLLGETWQYFYYDTNIINVAGFQGDGWCLWSDCCVMSRFLFCLGIYGDEVPFTLCL